MLDELHNRILSLTKVLPIGEQERKKNRINLAIVKHRIVFSRNTFGLSHSFSRNLYPLNEPKPFQEIGDEATWKARSRSAEVNK